jgi:GT2 family glycosyltransferase
MNKPKVAIVILNWNGLKHLQNFLPSVIASTYPNKEIIIGDNGSTDESINFVQKHYPAISIIANDQNYGFTGGYNRILEHVEADYFILLNSDVEVTAGWIEPVINLMEADNLVAAAAPKIKSYHQKTHFEHAGAAGGFIDRYGFPFCRGRIFYEIEEDRGQYDESGEVFWASGASLFIKSGYWKDSGGFDESFFAHMEEIDLCWRLKNKGLKIMYCAESTVYHLGGGTLDKENPFKTYLNFRNNLFMMKKNLPPFRAVIVIFIRFFLDFTALLRFLSEGKRKDALAVSKAHRNFLKNILRGKPRNANNTSSSEKRYPGKLTGYYSKSIIWDFFVRKIRVFSRLDF